MVSPFGVVKIALIGRGKEPFLAVLAAFHTPNGNDFNMLFILYLLYHIGYFLSTYPIFAVYRTLSGGVNIWQQKA
jgi:hypothetical protein